MSGSGERDPIFSYEDAIFSNEELLDVQHIPSPDRIVGRDEHISKVANVLNPVLFGSPPTNLVIYGKTGTGKSLIARHVVDRLTDEAATEGITVRSARIDCGRRSTETEAVKTLARYFNTENTGVSVPKTGVSTGDYYDRLWSILESECDIAIVVLDEIDKLRSDEILRNLSRAGEDENVTDTYIGIIGVSNKIDYPDTLSERVKSSFRYDDLVFTPYDATELENILQKREDAYVEGVLTDDVIPLCAALSAQEHGDARKAIDIFRHAGRIARDERSKEVSEKHVRAGKKRAEMNRFEELIRGTPTQGKATLLAISLMTQRTDDDTHSTRSVYQAYERIANEIGLDCLSERRVGELLDELDFLNVIRTRRTSRGRGAGMYNEHRLLEDAEVVKQVIVSDSRFSDWSDSAEETL
ncbi:Cdc6/Cdc18 family protein [Halobium palmae]|uniref:ORC1-type DNA replication protein n=1 Tax=Halobium palmae TaxID=1776492 RepID=A0ABD5RWP2_9EURY